VRLTAARAENSRPVVVLGARGSQGQREQGARACHGVRAARGTVNPAPCVAIERNGYPHCVTTRHAVRYYWGLSLCLVWFEGNPCLRYGWRQSAQQR